MTTAPALRRRRALLAAALTLPSVLVVADAVHTAPLASAAVLQSIAFEAPGTSQVVLGSLATRSNANPVTISGIGPYTMSGTDSLGQAYGFVTDFNYAASNVGWQRESTIRSATLTYTADANANFGGRTGVMQLGSGGTCPGPNLNGGITAYCANFGPEVYSQPFTATAGQALSFLWAAQRQSDDYEIYAFLVEVSASGGGYDYGSPATSTLLTYGRGANQGWTAAGGTIPTNGTYRFRFVNGTYDRTGGFALGSNMYIDSVVQVGLANPITFATPVDQIRDAAPFTLSATAPGGAVTFTSGTPSVCTVSGDTVTLVTSATGVCTIVANQAGDGTNYVPADSLARSFTVRAAATAPVNSGLPSFTGTPGDGNTMTLNEGSWGDGASPITASTIEWLADASPISGATGASCVLVASPGTVLSVRVTKTNAVGSTPATSSQTITGYTCASVPAPSDLSGSNVPGDGTVGSAYSGSVTGNNSPTSYTIVAGALPAGLSLNTSTGAITGTPTIAGSYTFTVRASNGGGHVDRQFTVIVAAAPAPSPAPGPAPSPTPPALPTPKGVLDGGGGVSNPETTAALRNQIPAGNELAGVAPTPDGNGAWAVTPEGKVVTVGTATFEGDLADITLTSPAVGIIPTESGKGYYVVAEDGGVFTFGDAKFEGSMVDKPMNAPVTSMIATCSGNGYYLVGADGGVFTFGDAQFLGSMIGKPLNAVAVGIVPDCRRGGYWVFAADGGVFTFGDAAFFGSLASNRPAANVSGMLPTATWNGYTLIDTTGEKYPFGDA